MLRSLPILAALGCGGGNDGSPADTPVIVLSQSSLSVIEGTPDTVTVVLDAAPPANVSVTLSSAGRVTLLPTTLDFTPANFATPKFVVVTPIQDVDLAAGVDTVTATAAGLVTVKVPVAIVDNDSQAVVLDSTLLSIVEGDSVTYGVKLAYQPLASVNVTLSPTDTMVVVTPTTLNFTPADYATPKSVKVRAKQDPDVLPDTLHIVATVPSGQFASILVSITDDDIQAILVDSASVGILEGDSATVHVRLAFQPAASTTVLIGSSDSSATLADLATLDFTPANYATPKAVRIRALQDVDLAADSGIIRFQKTGIGHTDLIVGVTDDDQQAIQTATGIVNVTEGDTAQLGVRLAFQPGGDQVVNVASLSTPAATVAPSTRTFTTANWDTYQYVTITGTQDNDAVAGNTTVRLSGSGLTNKDVPVNVTDDDIQAIVTSTDTVFVTEGQTVQLTLTLAFQPVSVDQVILSDFNTLVAGVSPTLTYQFTSANSATGFTIVVSGVEDANTTTDTTFIRFASNEEGMADHYVVVVVADND
jgi:hypothetical protein